MGAINLTLREIEAIKSIDERELDYAIDQSIQNEEAAILARFPLRECGQFVAGKLHYFEIDLREFERARSAGKREDALWRLRRSGEALRFAFAGIKNRMETEERHRELFYIDDQIQAPPYLTLNLDVDISYRWRKQLADDWTRGHITFRHRHEPRPDYSTAQLKRKPSKAQQSRQLQDELYSTWENLRNIALFTLRDFFEAGGDGNEPHRLCRRPQLVRSRVYDKQNDEQIFA